MELEKTKGFLNEFSHKYDLINRAITGCEVFMKNSIRDDKGALRGFSIDEILLMFDQQVVVFNHYLWGSLVVKTQIGLYKKQKDDDFVRGHEPIGYYVLDCKPNGEVIDDWLVVEEGKNNQLNILSSLKKMNNHLPLEFLRRNSIYYEYISYVNHTISFYEAQQHGPCQWFIKRAFEFIGKNQFPENGVEYFQLSKKLMTDLLNYMDECGLIKKELKPKFLKLGVLKANG